MKSKQKKIEDQGKKQVDALADLKPKEIEPRETRPKEIESNECSDYFLDEMARIRKSYESVDFNDLIYEFKDSRIHPVSFIKFKGPLHILCTFRGCRKRANRG